MKVFGILLRKAANIKPLASPTVSLLTTPTIPPKVKIRSRFMEAVFGKYLLTTNTVSSGLLMVVGDVMAQEIEYRKGTIEKRYDWSRMGKLRFQLYFL